jgi:tetrahydromethanopterin S-methyltransferase subunit G
MIDESILKSNFIGRDGFRWWIGQIPPIEAQKSQANGGGWGNRTKVRILGYHPYSSVELPNDELPWAQVLMPPTSGSGAANYAVNPKLRPGDTVLGFFLDGDNAQIPVIIGCFGRTDQVPSTNFKSPFVPFTGYTKRIPAPNGTLYKSEASEEKSNSQKSPRDVTPETTSKLNQKSKAKDEVFYFSGVGKKVVLGNSSNDTVAKGIGAEVNNLLQKVNDVTNKVQNVTTEISRSVDKIVGIANGFVAQAVNSLYLKLIPLLQQGLDALYKQVYAAVFAATQNHPAAHLAGVAAQTAMIPPVKALEAFIPKIVGIVVNNLFKTVKSMLTDTIKNVKYFKSCVGEQFVGSLLNEIIGKIQSGISGVLNGVTKILQFVSFGVSSVGDFLRSGVSAVRSIGGLFDVNQNKNKSSGNAEEWTIGVGIVDAGEDAIKFATILKNMNIANGIGNIKDGVKDIKSGWDIFSEKTKNKKNKSAVGGCYTEQQTNCSAPKVKVFGGSGKGVVAEAILGSFTTDASGVTTASVIGIKVKKKGKKYKYPPFVEIVDDCNQGYGAVARSVIDENGEVTNIYMVSEGENYPVGNINVNTAEDIAETNPAQIPNYVSDVYVQQSGFGYQSTDKGFDDFGNQYSITVDEDGSIVSVSIDTLITDTLITDTGQDTATEQLIPSLVSDLSTISSPSLIINNYIIVEDLPTITIESDTGIGAILNPILDKLPIEVIKSNESSIRETKFVKDCIT